MNPNPPPRKTMRLAGLEVADVGAANVSRNGRARMDPLRRRNDLRDVVLVWMDMVVGVRCSV